MSNDSNHIHRPLACDVKTKQNSMWIKDKAETMLNDSNHIHRPSVMSKQNKQYVDKSQGRIENYVHTCQVYISRALARDHITWHVGSGAEKRFPTYNQVHQDL